MKSAKRRTFSSVVFFSLLAVVVAAIVYSAWRGQSRAWLVPEQAKQLRNPLQQTATILESARRSYSDKCEKCHGQSGKGDGVDAGRYDPSPTDFTNARQMNGKSDGELFYKISEGKKPMPMFKAKLSEEQRWELVLLIRSFSPSPPSEAPKQ